MTRDWHAWHGEYDDPQSSLSRRLLVVRDLLRRQLAVRPDARVLSLCAGDGRDTLPVLVDFPEARATLVEIDPDLSQAARRTVSELGLRQVDVRTADAGTTESYAEVVPVDVLMACGVFGNITDEDLAATIAALPALLSPGGVVMWTRGNKVPQDPTRWTADPSDQVRGLLADAGFDQVEFVRPGDASFRVGVSRLGGAPPRDQGGHRLFTFV